MLIVKIGVAEYLTIGVAIGIRMFLDVVQDYPGSLPFRGTCRVFLRASYLALFWLPDFALFCWNDRNG